LMLWAAAATADGSSWLYCFDGAGVELMLVEQLALVCVLTWVVLQ
jgi:hypothetical protein